MSFARISASSAIAQTTTSSASLAVVTAAPVTAGNLLTLAIEYWAATNPVITSIVDGANTWVLAGSADLSAQRIIALYSCIAATSATLTITVTPSLNCTMSLSVTEYSFAAGATIAIDGPVVTGTGSSGTALTTSAAITPSGNDLVVSVSGLNNGFETFTAGAGFTISQHTSSGNPAAFPAMLDEYALNVSAPITPASSVSASTAWVILGVAFQEHLRMSQPQIIRDLSQSRQRWLQAN